MGKPQMLGHKKHLRVISRVGMHLHARGIHDFVVQSWAVGGYDYWFVTAAGRQGWWNPRSDELRFLPPDDYTARLIAEGNALTCPGGRTASLCRCQMFGMMRECIDYEKTHPRRAG
jgi:hypothetical protein